LTNPFARGTVGGQHSGSQQRRLVQRRFDLRDHADTCLRRFLLVLARLADYMLSMRLLLGLRPLCGSRLHLCRGPGDRLRRSTPRQLLLLLPRLLPGANALSWQLLLKLLLRLLPLQLLRRILPRQLRRMRRVLFICPRQGYLEALLPELLVTQLLVVLLLLLREVVLQEALLLQLELLELLELLQLLHVLPLLQLEMLQLLLF